MYSRLSLRASLLVPLAILVFITASVAGAKDYTQLDLDIDAEAAGDNSGYSVSLSSDGSVVAIGAVFNDGAGSDAGHVRVFEFQPEVAECTCDNLPTRDGNLTITGGVAPRDSAVLPTPNGFESIEILPGSDNIGLLNLTPEEFEDLYHRSTPDSLLLTG